MSVRCEFAKGRNPLVVALCVTMQAKATDNVLIFTNSCIFISLPHSYYLHSPIDGSHFAHPFSHSLYSNISPWLIPQKNKNIYKNCAVKAQPQSNLDIDFFFYFHSDLFIFTHQHIPVADGIETQNVECFSKQKKKPKTKTNIRAVLWKTVRNFICMNKNDLLYLVFLLYRIYHVLSEKTFSSISIQFS